MFTGLSSYRDRLLPVLRRLGPTSAPALAQALGVSAATALRMLKQHAPQVLAVGEARRRRYAARRGLRGDLSDLPVYAIDPQGRARSTGSLALVAPEGSWLPLDPAVWPLPEPVHGGWWPGLPYPLADMRPQGYMGRQFARQHHAALQLPPDPREWSDDQVLLALTQAGSDTPGDLVVGVVAFERWQAGTLGAEQPLTEDALGPAYLALAEQAMAGGAPGSSAAGEFPKFTARRALEGARTPHVIVKFSGADGSPTVQRWADLLVCEHIALQTLSDVLAMPVAASRIVQHGGRTFLESERFDRHGDFGRSPLVSLGTLDAALLGAGTAQWPLLARRLAQPAPLGPALLSEEQVAQVDTLWWYGRLIANSDMHTGNLSFRPQRTLALAPVYDMLPMLYAPAAGGEVVHPPFVPALPLPEQAAAWRGAARAAVAFWRRAGADGRVGAAFRATCLGNAERVEEAAVRV
ncbi:MAG TPA: type II toxin-antitoxin system HipA family toxin YjjJ [Ideonella sp.]|nr:type II toxin-antitoxin system HipA family toxin YjjJ [Ideonella sp.]